MVLDISSSMKSRSTVDSEKSREDMSKVLFHTMIDKLFCLEQAKHMVGLVAFGEKITPIGLTGAYERFHDELGRLDARENSTMLYDAILQGCAMVDEAAEAHRSPDSVKRVFVLTDGEDNASRQPAWAVAKHLQSRNVVMDAIPLAGPVKTLQAMCEATGGICFDVVSLEQGIALFESEAILHCAFRETKPKASLIQDQSSFDHLYTFFNFSNIFIFIFSLLLLMMMMMLFFAKQGSFPPLVAPRSVARRQRSWPSRCSKPMRSLFGKRSIRER